MYQASGRQITPAWVGDRLADVAAAAGLPPLSSVSLKPGLWELRVSADLSGMLWQPAPLLRLVHWADSIAGELYYYWPRLRDSTGEEIHPWWVNRTRADCRSMRETEHWAVCRIRPRPGVSWASVADSLTTLEIWKPHAPELQRGSNRTDQDVVWGEILLGGEYRWFWDYDLDRLPTAEARRLHAVESLITNLVAQ